MKETAFSGVFATVDALREAGAKVAVHDPMYSPDELTALGWDPYALGQPVDVAILQADHAEYRDLTAGDLPGASLVVDGRRILDRSRFPGVRVIVVGQADGR